jgi:hypothetical protein
VFMDFWLSAPPSPGMTSERNLVLRAGTITR